MRIHSKALVAAVVTAAGTLLAAATTFAYFTTTGAGGGTGGSSDIQTVTATALVGGDAVASTLRPGGPAADVILRVNNPNAFGVRLVGVTPNGAITADGGHSGCTTTGVSFTSPVGLDVALAAGSTLVHLSGAASMSTASLSACQGANFAIPVMISVRR